MEIKPGYKQTEIGVIPEDWEVDYIGKQCSITTGKRNTQDSKATGIFPFFVRSQVVERINSYSYDGEAVLTAGDGVGTGKVVHYINGKFDFHQRVYCLSGFAQVLDGYYFYLFFKNRFLARIQQFTAKTSVDSVRLEMISKMPVALPPLSEQKHIAEVMQDIDSLITSLEKLIEKKKLIKQGVMQELLTGKRRLPGFSREWEIKRLGNIASIKKGQQLNSDSFGDYGIYPVMNGGISPSGYTNDFNADGHTLIISEGGNSCGYVNYVDGRFWQGGHCYSIATNQDSLFLYYSLKYRESEIMGLRVGSGLPNVQKKRLSDFPILVPTIEEQSGIALILKGFDSAIMAYEQSLAKHILLKQAMMQELLTGRIRLI